MNFKPLDTSSFADSRFAPHGRVQVALRDDLIIYDVVGPFNIEAIHAFGNTLGELLSNWQPSGPFASLTFWHGSLMATHDALAGYKQLLQAGRKIYPKEVINVWCVPPDIEGRRIMQPLWQTLYDEAGYPLEIVADAETAQARLAWHLEQAAGNG